jgi:hypothetical protein
MARQVRRWRTADGVRPQPTQEMTAVQAASDRFRRFGAGHRLARRRADSSIRTRHAAKEKGAMLPAALTGQPQQRRDAPRQPTGRSTTTTTVHAQGRDGKPRKPHRRTPLRPAPARPATRAGHSRTGAESPRSAHQARYRTRCTSGLRTVSPREPESGPRRRTPHRECQSRLDPTPRSPPRLERGIYPHPARHNWSAVEQSAKTQRDPPHTWLAWPARRVAPASSAGPARRHMGRSATRNRMELRKARCAGSRRGCATGLARRQTTRKEPQPRRSHR